MAEREDIERFLVELKEKIRFFEIAFRPRNKNLQALADLDIHNDNSQEQRPGDWSVY